MTAPAIIQNPSRAGRRPVRISLVVFVPVSTAKNPRLDAFTKLSEVAAQSNGSLRKRRGRGAVVTMPKAGVRGRTPERPAQTFLATFRSSASAESFMAKAAAEVTGIRFGDTAVEPAE